MILEMKKYKGSLLIVVMGLQPKDRTTPSLKLFRISGDKARKDKSNKDRIREDRLTEDRIKEDRIREDRTKEDRTRVDLVKYRISLLMTVMVLQVQDRTTTSSKLVQIRV